MKKDLFIKILLLVVSIFSPQLANAYCMYHMEKSASQETITVQVFETKADYEKTALATSITKATKEATESFEGSGSIGTAVATIIPGLGGLIEKAMMLGYREAHHTLPHGKVTGTDHTSFACWNWNDIVRDVFDGRGEKLTMMFFVAFSGDKLIGMSPFPIGGYVRFNVDNDGKGAYQVLAPLVGENEIVLFVSPNYKHYQTP